MQLYESSALFEQNMSEKQQEKLMDFYQEIFSPYPVTTFHDCTLGAGGTTLPLARLGYEISGSDLSQVLIEQAKKNFASAGFPGLFEVCDLRSLKDIIKKPLSAIISTGNSLPHVTNQEVRFFLKQAADLLEAEGLFYLDMRNWDKLLQEKPLFRAYHPQLMTEKDHVRLNQIWSWHDDGSVDFVFATTYDQAGKHTRTDFTYAPTYYPLLLDDLRTMLAEAGFDLIDCYHLDHIWTGGEKKAFDLETTAWYGILAKKKV